MSWIKKIIGKKDRTDGASRSVPASDETVLFGDDSADPDSAPSYDPAPTARSSMISELAGLDPEASAYLSPSQEDAPADDHSEESISLDFEDPSDQQADAIPAADDGSLEDSNAGFQGASAPAFPEAKSDSQESPQNSEPDQQNHARYGDESSSDQPDQVGAERSIPELEFDSDSRLDTTFDDPPPEPGPNPPALLAGLEPDSSADPAADPNLNSETLPPSGHMSMIDQMAGGFDLDLGEEDEPTTEAFGISAPEPEPEPETAISDEAQSIDPATADQPAQPSPQDNDDYFDQLATAKMDSPAGPVTPNEAPHEADNFDATVITTAANEPSVAAGADYVTGWLVVVDGPDKGQSRPIRAGINTIGRAPDQDIPLYFGAKSDGEISRRDHARIVYDPRGNHFKLVHGASRNLTYLNDEAVLDITELKPYDRIVIGKTTLLFIPLCGNIFRW